jgi:hypothetical protein
MEAMTPIRHLRHLVLQVVLRRCKRSRDPERQATGMLLQSTDNTDSAGPG